MPRFFNTAGPNDPKRHYTLPILARLPEVRPLIDRQLYFVIHAPRQSGKTTLIKTLAQELMTEGKFTALFFSVESASAYLQNPPAAEIAILDRIRSNAAHSLPANEQPPPWPDTPPGTKIVNAFVAWCQNATKPLVLLIDEIDALEGPILISVLRQIREGYNNFRDVFPWSLALVGMRNVRDYKFASGGSTSTHSSSPFNIAAEALTLGNFTQKEIGDLYAQHTEETGQIFLPEAVERAYALTGGQPWLVNALARQLTEKLVPDRQKPISAEDVEQAKENLILRQDTHLDSLAERLRDPRIRAVIEPMLSGESGEELPVDDIRLALDLGLVRLPSTGGLEISNPIYREIVVRSLSASPRAKLPTLKETWLKADGRLNREALLTAFVSFWRQHGEALMGTSPYHEAAPHLVLMAFLHRVVNGGGVVEREYAIGMGRMDICVRFGGEVLGIELKVWREKKPDPERQGLEQLDEYLAGIAQQSGWLIIFDRRPDQPPVEQRVSVHQAQTPSGRLIQVVRA